MTSKGIKRIPLTVENTGGPERKAWPITQGVPFADRELRRGAKVRVVDSSGKRLPVQASCLGTWKKDLRYVKWLLADFQADLGTDSTETFFLEYGSGVRAMRPKQGVSVSREEGRLRVDTGLMRLDFRLPSSDGQPPVASFQRARNFLSGCWLKNGDDWHDVFRGKPGPFLYMVTTEGEIYDSFTAGPAPRVTVEDEGPLRVCVCVKGYHASGGGVRICPYTLRFHLYAGKTDLRMFQTFVFDQDPNLLEFSEVGMRFPLDLGTNLRMSFGGEDQAHWASRWEEANFLQDSDESYRVTRDDEPFGSGEKTRGWVTLSGSDASVFVSVRDFWQQYPKGYRLTKEGLDVQLWPGEYGEPMIFHTPWKERPVYFSGQFGEPAARAESRDEATVKALIDARPTAPLNLKSFAVSTIEDVRWVEEMVDKYAPDRTASHNDTGTNDGTGAAKTHELLLRFSIDPIGDEEAESLGICVQEPVIAPPDPAYMCSTRAARDLSGGPDTRFEEIDRLMDGIVEKIAIEPMHLGRQWGFWRFGNMCCSHTAGSGLAYELHYETDPVKGLRHVGPYNNEADDPCWGIWTQFMRTGRRDFFLAASGHSQAMGDVGTCHANPAKDAAGLMHYHNAHQWTGGYSPSHTLNTSIFLHYYFTGNRRMYEIALEMADWAVNTQEPAGIITCRNGRGNREFTGPLNCLMEAYAATWKPKYGDLARRSLNWLLRTQEEVGIFPHSVFTRGDRGDEAVIEPAETPLSHAGIVYPLYYEGLRHFNNRLLRETIIAEADHVITRGSGSHVTTACALAYELTGDPIYAAMCLKAVIDYREHALSIVEFRNSSIFSGIRNGYISILKAAAARAVDRDPGSFTEAEQRLKAAIQPPPPVEETFYEKSLGVPKGYEKA